MKSDPSIWALPVFFGGGDGVTGWLGALFFNIFKWAFFMEIQVGICFLQEMAE